VVRTPTDAAPESLLERALERASARIIAELPNSEAHYRRASHVIPDGTARARHFWPQPIYMARGEGGYVFDVDERRYVDCNLGFGPLILGHCHPEVIQAIERQLRDGVLFGAAVIGEAAYAEQLVAIVPGAEQVIFLNSGTEATMAAVRIARAATGREKVAKFEGGWHGWHDALFYSVHPQARASTDLRTEPNSRGMAASATGTVVTLPFNDEAAFDLLRAQGHEISCVMVEAIQGAAGVLVGQKAFLQRLSALTAELGIVLILDEVISGVRLGPGGAAAYYGIEPDISVLGKAIGGGLPIGVLCGRKELLETLIPNKEGRAVVVAGTTSGNPLTLAAAEAQLDVLLRDGGAVYERLWSLGERLRAGLEAALAEKQVVGALTGIGPWWGLHLGVSEPPANVRGKSEVGQLSMAALAGYLTLEGVHMMAPVHQGFLCTEHTEADVDFVVEAHARALTSMSKDGLLNDVTA
jgi:glutamate-1-semialdehyde 2,1-aminomutase